MTKQGKKARQIAAATADIERRIKRVMCLSIALIRTQVLFHQYDHSRRHYLASGISDDETIAKNLVDLKRLEVSDFTRMDTNLTFFLASLYAVVHYWRKWNFKDEEVDRLLTDPFVGMLAGFRHAHTHLDHFDTAAITIAEDERSIQWSLDLTAALKRSLISWHDDTAAHLTDELVRTQP